MAQRLLLNPDTQEWVYYGDPLYTTLQAADANFTELYNADGLLPIPPGTLLGNASGAAAVPAAITALPLGVSTAGGSPPVGTTDTQTLTNKTLLSIGSSTVTTTDGLTATLAARFEDVTTITGLPAAPSISGPEIFPAVQAGSDVKVTATQIAAFIRSLGGASPFASWGVPVILLPSAFIANNGVIVIGQAPSGSANVTLSATSGTGVTATFGAATLIGSSADVGRVLTILDSSTYRYFTVTGNSGSSTTICQGTISGGTLGTMTYANSLIWLTGPPSGNTTTFSGPLPTIFANCYVYLPAGAIATGIPATGGAVYYAQFVSTTVGTVFNNVLSGIPSLIGSPTLFATTSPGTGYAQSQLTQTLISINIPAGSMGNNGALIFDIPASSTDNSDTIPMTATFGGSLVATNGGATSSGGSRGVFHRTIRNMASQGIQNMFPATAGAVADSAASTMDPTFTLIDTTQAQTFAVTSRLFTSAMDYTVIYGGRIELDYAA